MYDAADPHSSSKRIYIPLRMTRGTQTVSSGPIEAAMLLMTMEMEELEDPEEATSDSQARGFGATHTNIRT